MISRSEIQEKIKSLQSARLLLNAKIESLDTTVRQIDEEIGRIQRELTHIQNHEFGFLGDEKRYPSLFEFVKVMLTNLLADAKSQNIDIALDEDTYLRRLDADRDVFSAVQSASLVHWDMWEGNVFVEQDHVSGIIDWERALWGDPLMDDRFRSHARSEAFLVGFGIKTFTEEEKKRIYWYDIILYLTMMIEVYFRDYEDKGQYFWAREILEKVLEM